MDNILPIWGQIWTKVILFDIPQCCRMFRALRLLVSCKLPFRFRALQLVSNGATYGAGSPQCFHGSRAFFLDLAIGVVQIAITPVIPAQTLRRNLAQDHGTPPVHCISPPVGCRSLRSPTCAPEVADPKRYLHGPLRTGSPGRAIQATCCDDGCSSEATMVLAIDGRTTMVTARQALAT